MSIETDRRCTSVQYREQVTALALEGYSYSRIAAKIGDGLTRATVAGVIYRARKDGLSIPISTKHIVVSRVAVAAKKKIAFVAEQPLAIGPLGDFPAKGCCKYPHGETAPFQWCGHPVALEGSPWCAFHHRVCYQPPRKTANDD